ncbi:PREDICTED: sucrose nonfermenting 4-like protein isoform X1 [Nicotiana attenuata]|uniref:Sucrose nonfermenting 4-like protein n=1 Tax=Nicotiana attenuata TaxID=49451 RepID=A0A1J6HZM1_NICAT|nr:PREDICTED: sucrose nonfermenting 4-like protein isoform X1 [Nicotiana attenuata]XP_019254428.1 PREDICTED: sucrose nonfermenting 4-like protein isoform X1 [Nicotiana attenuata]OIS97731.1 sucrose nonfermenting 4-like protein [Nicotiana attenuata]
MVLITFTWRYGGSQVFLYGSFNGWTDQLLMSLLEGSATVFQRIIDLPPGYHQYKFLIDGTWQVDQEQLCVQDEYGAINNLIFVKESDSTPSALLREDTQSKLVSGFVRSMHLEASSSLGLQLEPVMQLSANEIDVSRRRLFMLLSSSRADELIPNSGKVFALDSEVAVKQAFHIMYEQGLAVIPLWDERNAKMSGMLTASDFILILLKLHGSHSMLTNDELERHTVSAWKYRKFQLHAEVSGPMIPPNRRVLLQAGPDDSLKDVALLLLHNKISAVPLLHSPEDESCVQLLHTACLAGISQHICRHFRHSLEYLPLLKQPVGNLPLGTWAREVGGRASSRVLLTLYSRDLLSSALKLLIEGQVSSIPILDDDGALVNVYSRSDVTSLARGNVYARFRLDQMTMAQVLEVLDEASRDRCRTCTRFDSLYKIMELLSDPIVRRIVVIDPNSRQLEGIISLRDVFNLLLS